MQVAIAVDSTDPTGRTFLSWTPVRSTVRLSDAGGASVPVQVTLRNAGLPNGGKVLFDTKRSDSGSAELRLTLPIDGGAVEFWVAGEFQHPSSDYGDAAIEVVDAASISVGRRELMVRIRKDAVTLTASERDRFLFALGRLNDSGRGPFRGFRDTHVALSVDEAHGFPGFLPWHRAYLLDLERELQAIDGSVALPYWRFDVPAQALFAPDFLGMPSPSASHGDVIVFPHGHALEFWKTDGSDPIERRPRYNIASAPPQRSAAPGGSKSSVISQTDTLALGNTFAGFRTLEGAPHGSAHTSFDGPINSVPTAAKDPLFFLLHANVDRLWAFWQWFNDRRDPASANTYSLAGATRPPNDIGHRLSDTMWPWNGDTVPPRPGFIPPRGRFTASSLTTRPGATPKVGDVVDYQGVHLSESLGFDYDDVPFELQSGATV